MKILKDDLSEIKKLLTKLDEERTIYGPDEFDSLPCGEVQWCRIYQLLVANESAKEGAVNKGGQLFKTEATYLHLTSGYYEEMYRQQIMEERDKELDRAHKYESIANMRKARIISILALIISVVSLLATAYFAVRDQPLR